jgi:hypothetical protein
VVDLVLGCGDNFKNEIDSSTQELVMKKQSKKRRIFSKVGAELRDNPPRIVEKTRREKGNIAAEKQRKAILLSKARRAGARIPYKKSSKSRKKAIKR